MLTSSFPSPIGGESQGDGLIDRRLEGGAPGRERGMRLRHRHPAEVEPLAGLHLADTADLVRAYRTDLGITPGGLPVHQEHDGLTLADDLDPAQRDPVRDDVLAARMLDG